MQSVHELMYSVRGRTDLPFTRPVAVLLGEAMARTAARYFSYESRIRELIQLFVRERDRDKLKILAAELQRLLMLERTVPEIWRE